MLDDWDDDTDYHRAVGCTWLMIAVAVICSLAVVGLGVVAVFGTDFFLDMTEALGQ
ncbi:hypothetical protein [Streptomyces sp. NPDC021622]|uniref:hypothetical protein n=1 Tax=Streptomyces sp. NPDC021622 TaxID=3155013 RepID=UPI0033E35462